jgi:hypothetical protein
MMAATHAEDETAGRKVKASIFLSEYGNGETNGVS